MLGVRYSACHNMCTLSGIVGQSFRERLVQSGDLF